MGVEFCFIFCSFFISATYAAIPYPFQRNVSQVALALSEIINGLGPKCLTVLAPDNKFNDDVDDFIYKIHELHIKSCVFFNYEKYFDFISNAISGSVETWSLIFDDPFALLKEIHTRNLAHRLNLFIFYWGAKMPPKASMVRLEEPTRAVIITRPRKSAFRVYYNQAVPGGSSNLRLVNWYDEESLGLYKTPLLPEASTVYSNFHGRVFYVPVIHSPPWHFVVYYNQTTNTSNQYYRQFKVIGGRDHHLLQLIAKKMNFKFHYLDPHERTQGSSVGSVQNASFTGGLGIIQSRAHFLFGDVGLSWERRKAAEFSFFTLLDSGAFATHAPRRLNEALAFVRPFQKNVWPLLIITVLLSGPVFYFVIILPYRWEMDDNYGKNGESFVHHPEYINEITLVKKSCPKIVRAEREMPENLFDKCVWFTIQLFLKQSCSEPYSGARARFLMIVYWIAATYVLADVYSAQLTSLFARPARESPIDTLFKLEHAMKNRGYQLYIEKDSSVLQMLENSTEVFNRLYKLMQSRGESFLVNSIEEGIQSILNGAEKVILGGRETLYFNIKRYGTNNFQLSRQLYTRYSAVAVQIGCPFLESFNSVLTHLFESGIMGKITNSEYEKMLDVKDQDRESEGKLKNNANTHKLIFDPNIQPINLRMLQGAFIILIFGNVSAGVIVMIEIAIFKKNIKIFEKISYALQTIQEILEKIIFYLCEKVRKIFLIFLCYIIQKK